MDSEIIGAVARIATAAAAVGPTAEAMADRVFGPALDAVGAHYGERARAFLTRNRDATILRATAMIEESGREPHQIPLRLSIPLLEGASGEDHDSLSEMWAALIANASVEEADF